jgi:hypothetical protein
VNEQNPTRAWKLALDAWSMVLSRAPDDEKARRWHTRCLRRFSLEAGDTASFPVVATSEALEALMRCERVLRKELKDYEASLDLLGRVLLDQPGHADAHGARCHCLIDADRWEELPAAAEAALPYLAPNVLSRIAQQATKREKWPQALQLWRLVARQGATGTSLAHVVESQILCAHRLGLDEYRPETPPWTGAPPEARFAVDGRRPRLHNEAPRHIVIMGTSFCGSTLLGLVLGRLAGVANVGESHWLIHKRRQRSSQDLPPTPEGFEQCMSCGPHCPIVTDDLRRRLADTAQDFYATLAAAYSADIIVTSDKSPHHVLGLDPLLQNDTIVLFRDPLANWQSHRARHPAFASAQGQRDYFRNWADGYDILLRYFHNAGTKIIVNFDEFAAEPRRVLHAICRRLSLPFDPESLAYWRTRQHFVGGNIMLAARLRAGDEAALGIGPRAACPDAGVVPEAADEFARATQVWQVLRRRQVCDAAEE